MGAKLSAYDPAQVSIVFGGALIQGTVSGSRVKVGFQERFKKTVGTDGEVARSKSNDKTVMITVELLQTSLSNDILMAFHLADDAALNGFVVPCMIKNLLGTFLVNAPGAWIVGLPKEVNYAAEVGGNLWVIDTGQATSFVGGQVSLT